MQRQYHPFGLHRPARLTRSGRPEGVLLIGDFTRIAGELFIIEAFLPRSVDVAERGTGTAGECQASWQRRYLVHGMYEVALRSLRDGRSRVVPDMALVDDYRHDRTHQARAIGRAGRHALGKARAG
jgi:hypothetical protein